VYSLHHQLCEVHEVVRETHEKTLTQGIRHDLFCRRTKSVAQNIRGVAFQGCANTRLVSCWIPFTTISQNACCMLPSVNKGFHCIFIICRLYSTAMS